MPTMHDSATRAAIFARFDALKPDARPAWGRMTAPQMVAHLTDAVRMAVGELPITPKHAPLARTAAFKWLFLNVLPFPKNAPTARELVSRVPEEWSTELTQFKVLMERAYGANTGVRWAAHPLFGTLTSAQWGQLAHKHIDHHLRQFGA
jgi:Protein of unknown function (DUF1569)